VFHADDEPTSFTLPDGSFTVLLDTTDAARDGYGARGTLDVGAWSVVVLRDESERARVLEVGVTGEHADPEAGAALRGAD